MSDDVTTNESAAEPQPTTSRRDMLTALAVYGCCMTVGASLAEAAPGDGPAERGPGGGGGGGANDRVPPAKPGKKELDAVGEYAKDGIYDKHARTAQVLIVRENDTLHAMSSICTHKRCVLRKRDEEGLKCPCHQAQFDKAGIVAKGPAKESLAHYAITLENGKVVVDTSKAFAEKDWADPAASLKLSAGATTKPA